MKTEERIDGSFMRIEVISMLKLAVASTVAVSLLLLFMILGYYGAPDVSMSGTTSAPSRCMSELTLPLYKECAAANNANIPELMDNSTSAIVADLLRLSPTEHVNVLGCMMDACTSETSRPMNVEAPDELFVAHYSVPIEGFTQRHRYFYLEFAFENDNVITDHSFEVSVIPHVRAFYHNESAGNFSTVDLLQEHRILTFTISCSKSEYFCKSQHFLRIGDIAYPKYQVDVLFNASTPLPLDGRSAQFRKTWGTSEFTNWMLGIKYFFLILSGFVGAWYITQMNALTAREQNLEQGWVIALIITLGLFNDPFYAVEATIGGNSVKVLSVLFQVTFFQMLLLFWLVALDNFRLQGRESGVSNALFFTPKVLFAIIFWLAMAIYYGYIKYQGNSDPMWDPLAENANFRAIKGLVALLSVLYLIWFLALTIMSRREFRARRPRYRFLLILSLAMVVASFAGLGTSSFSPTPASGGAWTSFQALFNIYVFTLCFLYAPSAATLRDARQRNAFHGKSADPEACPALHCPPPDDAPTIDVVEVETQHLDIA